MFCKGINLNVWLSKVKAGLYAHTSHGVELVLMNGRIICLLEISLMNGRIICLLEIKSGKQKSIFDHSYEKALNQM